MEMKKALTVVDLASLVPHQPATMESKMEMKPVLTAGALARHVQRRAQMESKMEMKKGLIVGALALHVQQGRVTNRLEPMLRASSVREPS